MEDSLENIKNEVMSFIKNNGFNLFIGFTSFTNEVRWDPESKNWTDFLEIAKKENIKTIVYDDSTLIELFDDLKQGIEQIQEISEDQNIVKETKKQIESYSDIAGKISFIQLSWIKEGVCYYFQLSSSVFDRILELKAQIGDILDTTKKTESLEKERRELSEKRDTLVKLSEEIATWAKSENLKKVTRPQVSAYLIEKEIYVSYENKLSLISMVNRKLCYLKR
ncbi:hypothetical protein JXA31_05655 [Candidatus Bathyarchaeota archaeon]|nr:hypothetical protein [Candidatus Bathyarchaeota archaeon]